MKYKILADESVHYGIVKALRNQNIEVISILEQHRGITDREVIELSRSFDSIILTEDSDFGEWVFAHKVYVKGVIFLRYKSQEVNNIIDSLTKVILDYEDDLLDKFVVVTPTKIRIRDILY